MVVASPVALHSEITVAKGPARGFDDMRRYKEEGREPPLRSTFKTYSVIAT